MWALQSDRFAINWNFLFGKQINWAAAEAAWVLSLDATRANDWELVKAAMVDTGTRGELNSLPQFDYEDGYDSDDFERLAMRASDAREDANDARLERMREEEGAGSDDGAVAAGASAAAASVPTVGLDAYFASTWRDVTGKRPADLSRFSDGAPATGLPEYAESRARKLADRTPSPSPTSADERLEQEEEEERRRKRPRYVHDEAEERDGSE